MSISRLLLACIALFWLGCASAATHNKQATERAFDALLSMPQAQPPDTSWNVGAPQGYDGSSEDDLIAWLAQQRHDGADLNAYRHDGTILQHAIRSHMPKVARWLLAHGADPTLSLRNDNGDALSLAIQNGQWSMVEAMLASPAFRQQSPQQLTAHYLSLAPNALPDMLKHGFAMPAGDTARCMLQYVLDRGQFALALQLPANRPLGDDSKTVAAAQLRWCNLSPPTQGQAIATRFATLDPTMLEKLDKKLTEPLLPYLLATLKTVQDVQALFALPLRKPDTRAKQMQLLGQWIVPIPPPADGALPLVVREALVEQLPQDTLAAMLADGKALNSWLYLAARSSTEDFASALNQVPRAALAAHPAIAVQAIGDNASQWASLFARPEFKLDGNDIPPLLNRIPFTLMAPLFAHGYRVHDQHAKDPSRDAPNEVAQWLHSSNVEALRQSWSLLAAHVPGLTDQAIDLLLQHQLWDCPSNQRYYVSQVKLDKIRALVSLGATVRPNPLPALGRRCTDPAIYAQLLALGVVASPDPDAPKRFVYEPMSCRFVADDTWLKTLTTRSIMASGYADTTIGSIQPIDYPGQASCGVLVTGGDGVQEVSIDDENFIEGPSHMAPCADPSPRVEQVWMRREGQLEISEIRASTSGLVPLRDRADGGRYYVAFAQVGDRCSSGASPTLLTWSTETPYHLQVVDQSSPAFKALQVQCALPEIEACLGIHGYGGEARTPGTYQTPWDASRSANDFIDRFFAKQRADWINATLKLDASRLRQLEAAGAPTTWVLAGIDAVTHSKLSLTKRRQRTAWLFRDGTRLSTAFDGADYPQTQAVVFGLDDWLPREDWRPLLEALAQATNQEDPDYPLLERLANEAQAKGKSRLACRLSRAAGKPCVTTCTD